MGPGAEPDRIGPGGNQKVTAPPAYPFQREGTAFLLERGRAILGDDPGLGKTRQALEAAEAPLLVSGPAALEGTWDDEVTLWRPDLIKDEDWFYAPYSMICRRGLDAKGRLSKVEPYPRPEWKQEWCTRIADEAHYLKGRNTNWTEAYERIRSDRLYLLTGTPVPNWAHEIFMLLKLVGPPGVDVNSFWRWAGRWFRVWESRWNSKAREIGPLKACKPACAERPAHDPCEHWLAFIVANGLHTHMLARSRDEVGIQLPPMTQHLPILCEMVPAQRKAYKELKKDYLTWVEGAGEVSAWSDGELHSKLSQITTGLETMDPALEGSGKLDTLQELMRERVASPTLIGVQFRNTARAVVKRLAKVGIDCGLIMGGIPQVEVDSVRRRFQAGKLVALVGTYEKIAEGMTFTAADTAIMVERSWKPSRNEQFIRRVHRIGQTRPTNLITLLTPKSIDQRMTKTLDSKTDQQVRMFSAQEFAALLLLDS